jgi:hypothetical protein
MTVVAASCSQAVNPGDSGCDGGCACCAIVVAEERGDQTEAYKYPIGEGVEDVDIAWTSEKISDDY